jgi:RNA polymerase sigma-70 factor (ECF subfamily)
MKEVINPIFHHSQKQLDEELSWIEEAKHDISKFDRLYKKYYSDILKYIKGKVDCLECCYDITSTVFIVAMNKLHTYEFKGVPFSSWLYRIAFNESMQFYREEKKKSKSKFNDELYIFQNSDNVLLEKYEDHLKVVLEKLKPEEKQLIDLRYFDKRPFKEISQMLGITEVNAKIKTYRILEKLKKLLKNK